MQLAFLWDRTLAPEAYGLLRSLPVGVGIWELPEIACIALSLVYFLPLQWVCLPST